LSIHIVYLHVLAICTLHYDAAVASIYLQVVEVRSVNAGWITLNDIGKATPYVVLTIGIGCAGGNIESGIISREDFAVQGKRCCASPRING